MTINSKSYYEKVADNYAKQYQKDSFERDERYPQNYYRLQWLVERVANLGLSSIYEVGTGEGTPLVTLSHMGIRVAGCDIAENMVSKTRKHFNANGLDENLVTCADIENSLTFSSQVKNGPYDGLIAFGIMPHIQNDHLVLKNMKMLVKNEGKVFIEFRNKLFSLFTMNRFTKEFILDDLLSNTPPAIKELVGAELDKRMATTEPATLDPNSYSNISNAKYHNPFEVTEMMTSLGFSNPTIHWYHYHAAPPIVEKQLPSINELWLAASKMENTNSWKGHFLCSAFVVEATVKK